MPPEDHIRSKPDEQDSWRQEEPDIPDWEMFMISKEETIMEGKQEEFSYITLDMKVPEDTYYSSTYYVDLEDWE